MEAVEHAAYALTGRAHAVMEDAVIEPLELPGGLVLAGVFDGISSLRGGDRAASAAAKAVRDSAADALSAAADAREALIRLAEIANGAVLDLQAETGERMGTTMSVCILDAEGGVMHVAHIGDSVLLRMRGGVLSRLTGEDVDGRGRLTRWLGQPRPLDRGSLYFWSGARDGDRFLLGTDGAIRGRTTGDCVPLLRSGFPLPDIARGMAETAREVTGDDISVILMDYHHGGRAATPDAPTTKDDNNTNKRNDMKLNTKSGGFALLIILALLFAGFLRLYCAQEKRFRGPDEAVNMDAHTPVRSLAAHLNRPERIEDAAEADFTARHIKSKMPANRPLTTLSVLSSESRRKKRLDFSLPLDSAGRAAIRDFPGLSARMEAWDEAHGVHDAALAEAVDPDMASGTTDGKRLRVRVRIVEKCRLPLVRKRVRDTVLIRVRQHWVEYDTAGGDGRFRNGAARDSLFRLVKAAGGAATLVLPAEDSAGNRLFYSVLPVHGKGYYAFGAEKGTYRGGRRMTFVRTKAVLMPLGKDVVRDMREKGDVTVRTPGQYRAAFFGLFLLLAAAWTAAYLCIRAGDARRGRRSDHRIVVAAAGITGLGILTLLGIPAAPLADGMRASNQVLKGIIPGVAALILTSRVDWGALFDRDRRAYRNDAWQGALLAASAALTALVLLLVGSGPGGAKVNILFFQGQPLIKYAMVGYLAIYLANRTDTIPAYASRDNRYDRMRQAMLVAKMTVLLVCLLFAQVVLLHDMGPGVVLVMTAAVCYSVCRRDVLPTLAGLASFLLLAWAWNTFIGRTFTLAVPLVWTAAWVAACRTVKGRVYESAIPLVMVVAALLWGGLWLDAVGLHEAGARLSDRVACWQAPFDSHTSSNQLAQAAYGYAEGGLTGRAGRTMTLVPEAHTDFIWAAVVSQWGLAGAAAAILLFALLLSAGTDAAARNRRPFCFYLGACITCSVATQALFILGSCTLLWPLSGVPLFGMSFGSTSLVLDLAAAGALVSLSRGGSAQEEWDGWSGNAAGLKAWRLVALAGLLAVFAATSVYSVFRRDHYLTVPTVSRLPKGGHDIRYARTVELFARDSLKSGDILDRNGEVLATDGAEGSRRYPAGELALFWVGDQTTGVLRDRTDRYSAGVLSDYRWDAKLRGFDLRIRTLDYETDVLKPDFLPETPVSRTDTLYTRDYTGVLPYWKSPRKTREWNDTAGAHPVVLTLDLHLLEALTQAAEEFFPTQGSVTSRTRFSGVVVDAVTGEVLASACFPAPDQERLRAMAEAKVDIYRDDTPHFRAFPDMDLACCHATSPGSVMKLFSTVAGFRKAGEGMKDVTIRVAAGETIYPHEPSGLISLATALWQSSNLYFIHALNRLGLYDEMERLFWTCGVSFEGRLPYCLYPDVRATDRDAFRKAFSMAESEGLAKYRDYLDSGNARRLNDMAWTMAWGGGSVQCSPLAVARLLSAIAHDGVLTHSRFSMDDPLVEERLLPAEQAGLIRESMKPLQGAGPGIRGKTGTAERYDALSASKKSNDAWYAFYVDGSRNPRTGHALAVAVRFERVGDATSTLATDFVRKKMLPAMQKEGYLSRLP